MKRLQLSHACTHPYAVTLAACAVLAAVHALPSTAFWGALLALVLIGPLWTGAAAWYLRPHQHGLYHAETLVQCALVWHLSSTLQYAGLSSLVYAGGLALTHFAMMFMSCDNDRSSARISRAAAFAMIGEAAIPLMFQALGSPMPFWLVTLLWVVSLLWWRDAMWSTMDLKPMSLGQHRSYWTAIHAKGTIAQFWGVLVMYAALHPEDLTPPKLAIALSRLNLSELLTFWDEPFEQYEPTLRGRIGQAVRERICALEPRAQMVFDLLGNDPRLAAQTVATLDTAQSTPVETLELPPLGGL